MITKNYRDPDWYKRRIEKSLSYFSSGAKKLTDSSLKRINDLQECSQSLLNDYAKLKKEKETLEHLKVVEETLIANTNEGIIVIDSHCKVSLLNKKMREFFGINSREKIVNSNYFEHIVFCKSDTTPIPWREDPISKAFTKNKKMRITLFDDLYCLRKDGTIFPVTASISPFNIDETTRTIAVTLYDVTKEKQTADIRSDFVSVASHQLKTPLSISNAHTEILLREHLGDGSEKTHLEEILFGNKKIEELINRFFIISKIGAGTLSLFKQHHDVNYILEDILHELSININKKNLDIKKVYDSSCIGYVDWVLLRIALHNIISNAIKYNKDGGEITLTTKNIPDALQISISDTGCGIPENEQGHVFMKFYRGLCTNKRTTGSGVGLYITKAIVEQCEGKIWFESVENKGTTFHVTLPISSDKK